MVRLLNFHAAKGEDKGTNGIKWWKLTNEITNWTTFYANNSFYLKTTIQVQPRENAHS